MAASSDNGGRRSNSSKLSGKAERPSRKAQGDESDKICGFHPLRSLRNIFFGYRTRGRPSLDEDADGPAAAAAKAKSTDDIAEQSHRRKQDSGPIKAVVPHAPVTATNSAQSIQRPKMRAPIPMVKQLSKSADNLASPSEWIPAPHGIPSAVTSPSGSEDSNLNASEDDIDCGTTLDSKSIDEFFTDKWSQANRNSRTRAFSSGDAQEIGQEMTCDLDSVSQTKALDVSVTKDRIAIKPKNKRATVAMQQKMLRAETTPRPTKSYHLQSLTEADEDEGESKKAGKTDPSAAATTADAGTSDKPPDRPIRREKKPLQPAPDKSGRMTINITPDMLAGARKKAIDRSSVAMQISPTIPARPPPPTCPKKRKTIIDQPEEGVLTQDNKPKEEGPAQNGAALGAGVVRRPLLSLKEDEVVADGEDGEAPTRPKAPPRVRPKTRPKTMMPSSSVAPPTAETDAAEWMNRANQKNDNALVD